MYADMFFTLRNHPEWQRECGVNIALQDPLVLAMEKEKRDSEKLKRCGSACNVGQRCLELREIEERMEDFVSPPLPPPVPAVMEGSPEGEGEGAGASAGNGNTEQDSEDRGSTPITARTRSKTRPVLLAPLRQAMGTAGPTRIKIPFIMNDLDSWREVAKGYR